MIPYVFDVEFPGTITAMQATVHCLVARTLKVYVSGEMRNLSYNKDARVAIIQANFRCSKEIAVAAIARGRVYRDRPAPQKRIVVLGVEDVQSALNAEVGEDESDESEDEDEEAKDSNAVSDEEKMKMSMVWFLSVDSNSEYARICERVKRLHSTRLYKRAELPAVDAFGEHGVERILPRPCVINDTLFMGEVCFDISTDSSGAAAEVRTKLVNLASVGTVESYSTTSTGDHVIFHVACKDEVSAKECRTVFGKRQRVDRVRYVVSL
jgi:hypothetical protein